MNIYIKTLEERKIQIIYCLLGSKLLAFEDNKTGGN